VLLCREVIVVKPHQSKEKTRERGECWQKICDNLNVTERFANKLSVRSVRDKTTELVPRFRTKQRAELNATGISH